ncbi:hypothetical protein [Chromobacterium phragmitis]
MIWLTTFVVNLRHALYSAWRRLTTKVVSQITGRAAPAETG